MKPRPWLKRLSAKVSGVASMLAAAFSSPWATSCTVPFAGPSWPISKERLSITVPRWRKNIGAISLGWPTSKVKLGIPKPKYAVSGPGGVEASFDWRAAYDETADTMLRARLLNDVAVYT